MPVEVVNFDPVIRPPGIIGRFRAGRKLGNFGDLIGPVLVERIAQEMQLSQPKHRRRLATVGSIMKLTRPGDVVWGSGVNGKSMHTGGAPKLDVRAVRGPLTKKALEDAGTTVPDVFGDPAILWSLFWPRETYLRRRNVRSRRVGIVPNFHDKSLYAPDEIIDPIGDPHDVIAKIAACDFVCGSSLHGIVIAEALGIPARLIRPGIEPSFKYDDYYQGTGRATHEPAPSVSDAVRMGGETSPSFDSNRLLGAFPKDIFAEGSPT